MMHQYKATLDIIGINPYKESATFAKIIRECVFSSPA